MINVSKYSTFVLNKLSSSMFLKLYILSCGIKKQEPIYGKEVLDYIHSFNIAWKPSHGTLYPIMNSMCEEKLIEFAYEYEGKKYYNVTEEGRIYYKDRANDFKNMLFESSNFYKIIAEELQL